MMVRESVSGIGQIHRDRAPDAIATLTRAFSADPVNRWVWPDAEQFLRAFPRLVQGLGGRAFEREGAFEIAGMHGVALWLRPGVDPDEQALGALVHETIAADKQGVMAEILEQMGRVHPREAHWYLPFVGVDPLRQGQGLGAALLRPILEQCDEEQLPAYLESTNARNIPFYQRLGFRRAGIIDVHPCPAIVPMRREPRSG